MMSLYPELVDLSSWIPDKQTTCDEFPDQVWKLLTPDDEGIYQVIIISYLKSHLSRKLKIQNTQLKYRVNLLFGSKNLKNESFPNKLMRSIKLYNPFRNMKHPIFSKKFEEKAIGVFKEKLNTYFKDKMENCDNSNICAILTAASSMLKCSIFLYKTDGNNLKSLETYCEGKVTPKQKLHIFNDFYEENNSEMKNSFSYGFTKDDAFVWRRNALKLVLKLIKLDNIINTFKDEIFMENDFLISILKSPNVPILNTIFNFPFSAMELVEIGFNTNPLKTDKKGLSAFYYAFMKADISLIMLLYNYAANNFYLTDDTCRKPEAEILNALGHIRQTLENDNLISANFSSLSNKDVILHLHSQLMHFTEYQMETVREIIGIRNSNLNEKEKILRLVIAVIDKYKSFAYINTQPECPINDKFSNYLEFNDYYNMMDNYFAFLFFDNFLSLASFLKSPTSRIADDAAASLFLLLQSKLFFNKNEGLKFISTKQFQCYIPFYYRENCLQKALRLKQELENIGINNIIESNDVKNVVRSILINHPEISNIMIAGRVRHYATIALQASNDRRNNKTFKKMLVMERALQVVGELVQNEGETNSPVKHYLCSCLQEDAEPKIMWIRNCLSHYSANYIQGQLHIEKKEQIYEKLYAEFKSLNKIFDRIEITHLDRIQDIMIQKALDSAKLDFQTVVPYLEKRRIEFSLMQRKSYLKNKVNFDLIIKNMLNYIAHTLDKLKTSPLLMNKKTLMVKNQVDALSYLLEYKINFSEGFFVSSLQRSMESFRNFLLQIKEFNTINQIEAEISPLLKECSNTASILSGNDEAPLIFHAPLITKELGENFQKHDIFNSLEKNIIRQEIKLSLEKSNEAKNFCIENLDTEDINVLKKKLSRIIITKERKIIIENLLNNTSKKKAKVYLEKIEEMTLDNIFKSSYSITDIILSMSTDAHRILLLQLNFKGALKRKVHHLMNQKVFFLIDRIQKLKKILIEEDDFINHLWNYRKNEKFKRHIKGLISQRYLHSYSTRAAAEMLIMDCMGVFGDKKKELWVKADNLFSGINLRDILVHGNPLIQRASSILDPRDFVYALIDHVIELIEDEQSLCALSKLWFMKKETNLSDFIRFIEGNEVQKDNSERGLSSLNLTKLVKSSNRWKKYVKLLPLRDKS